MILKIALISLVLILSGVIMAISIEVGDRSDYCTENQTIMIINKEWACIDGVYKQQVCLINGTCILQSLTVTNLTVLNFLNVTITNINVTNLVGEHWVNESGDTMNGKLHMQDRVRFIPYRGINFSTQSATFSSYELRTSSDGNNIALFYMPNSGTIWQYDDDKDQLELSKTPRVNSKYLIMNNTADSIFYIEADRDNSGEGDNPSIQFYQDGKTVYGWIGYEGNAGSTFTGTLANSFYMVNQHNGDSGVLQFGTNSIIRQTITLTGDSIFHKNINATHNLTMQNGAIYHNGSCFIIQPSPTSGKLTVCDG